jgi:hypothetical protein
MDDTILGSFGWIVLIIALPGIIAICVLIVFYILMHRRKQALRGRHVISNLNRNNFDFFKVKFSVFFNRLRNN